MSRDDGWIEPRDDVSPLGAVAGAVGLTLVAIALSILGGVAFVLPLLFFDVDVRSTPVLVALTAAGQLGFLVAGYGYARRHDIQVHLPVPDRRDVAYGVGGALVALVLVTLLSVVVALLDLVPGSVLDEAITTDPTLLLGLAALSVILVAPIEEFLFRGVVQGRLRQAFGPVAAIAGSSLLFGSVHLANYTGNPASIVAGALVIAGTGSVLGALYERTGTLAAPVVAHAVYNLVLLGLAYVGL